MLKRRKLFIPPKLLEHISFDSDMRSLSECCVPYALMLSASIIVALLSPVAAVQNVLFLAVIWRNPSLRTPSYILRPGFPLPTSAPDSSPILFMPQLNLSS